VTAIPNFDDPQKRVLAATVGDVRIVDLYVVNGEAVGSEKFAYKLRWLEAGARMVREELRQYPNLVVLGDFNIAPDDRDVHDPEALAREDPVLHAGTRCAALACSISACTTASDCSTTSRASHSWWDYRLNAFERGWGLRIDLVLISEALRARCVGAGIDTAPRSRERPSDHTPVWVEIK
jgi:exodeoxyribonuclease-3